MSLTAASSSPSESSRIFRAARPILPRPLMATVGISDHLLVSSVSEELSQVELQDPAVAEVRRLGRGIDPHRRGELGSLPVLLRPDRPLVRERVGAVQAGDRVALLTGQSEACA